MAKKIKFVKPVAGADFVRQSNGVIVVSRHCPELRAPYDSDEKIPDYLSLIDHSLAIEKRKHYEADLKAAELELNELVRGKLEKARMALLITLQGRDGAGKTGTRKVVSEGLDDDDKIFSSFGFGPPEEHERKHAYLWRFFTGERMPRVGQVRVFDRCWQERVLVEKVMKLTPQADIEKSFAQVRSFEWMLNDLGVIVVKFWLDISKDEQKKRFEERAKNKKWKLSDSDEVARSHWDDYTVAANELIHRTGTDFAPQYLISSEDKRYCRVAVLQTINQAVREALKKR
jgi:polyphosphate kinase 2 (PPK2 family)